MLAKSDSEPDESPTLVPLLSHFPYIEEEPRLHMKVPSDLPNRPIQAAVVARNRVLDEDLQVILLQHQEVILSSLVDLMATDRQSLLHERTTW